MTAARMGLGSFEEQGHGQKGCWIYWIQWRGRILPLGMGSALQEVSARCSGCHVELGFSMEIKKKIALSLLPKGCSSLLRNSKSQDIF